jgi:hypothetical protein
VLQASVASVAVNLPGGDGDSESDPSLPIDLTAEASDADHEAEAGLASEVDIDINGSSATISGSVDASFTLTRLQLLSGLGGDASGNTSWSVSFTVSATADYRLSVDTSGSSSGLPGDCDGSLGVLLTDSSPGDLQAFYADGCGESYPNDISEQVEGTLEAGTYVLTVTSNTPLDPGLLLQGSFGNPELLINSTFTLELTEEGENFPSD